MTTKPRRLAKFVLCLNNRGYAASLSVRHLYEQLADEAGESRGLVRVVDESGEDYLFPRKLFTPLELPVAVRRRLTT